jgi:hypothetical protein
MKTQLLLEQVLFILLVLLFISGSLIFYYNYLNNLNYKNSLIKNQIYNLTLEDAKLNNQSNLLYYQGYHYLVGTIIIKNS